MRNILLILLSNLILNFAFSQCEGRYQEQIFEDSGGVNGNLDP